MMNQDERPDNPETTDELLADRALGELSSSGAAELRGRLSGRPGDPESLDRAAGLIAAAEAGDVTGPLPAGLAARLRADARAFARPAGRSAGGRPFWRSPAWAGGLAAAVAVAAILVRTLWPQPRGLADERRAFIDAQADILVMNWTPTADPNARGAWGDVVWSTSGQAGYMQFVRLAPNRADEQYQLWIFDADRDQRYPVDGALFDVPATPRPVIVPIRPRVAVGRPTLFAVTLERRGGVVVSKRERLPLSATVPDLHARPSRHA